MDTNHYFSVSLYFRGAKSKPKKGVEVYDSDDERAYKNEKVPDPRSGDFFNDEVDDFHAKRDQVSLLCVHYDMLTLIYLFLYIGSELFVTRTNHD